MYSLTVSFWPTDFAEPLPSFLLVFSKILVSELVLLSADFNEKSRFLLLDVTAPLLCFSNFSDFNGDKSFGLAYFGS